MFSKALKTLTFACSSLLLAVVALGSDLSDFRDELHSVQTEEEFLNALQDPPASFSDDKSLSYYADFDEESVSDIGWRTLRQQIVEEIEGLLAAESLSGSRGTISDPSASAKEILSSPIYVDAQGREGRNWLDSAATRLGNRIFELLRKLFKPPDINLPNLAGAPSISGWTIIAWFLLGAAILLIVYFILINFKGVGRRRRRVGGILEDDEPERTADQWLDQANALQAQGRYREAVRCLYLACLVRYDDGRVAHFRRQETNWEHLYRIEASPQNPSAIDFRATTQRFDKVWYGHQCEGEPDVNAFKEVYKRLCEALQIKTAA